MCVCRCQRERDRDAALAPRVIQHRNTRLPGATLLSNTLPTPQDTAQETAAAQLANRGQQQQQGYLSRGGTTAAATSGGERADRGNLVAMTPSPMPGGYLDRGAGLDDDGPPSGASAGEGDGDGEAGVSPLMTWGEVVGTPLCLDPSQTPLHGSDSSSGRGSRSRFNGHLGSSGGLGGGDEDGIGRFRIGEGSQREALARSLEAQTAAKKAKKRRRAEDELARLTGEYIAERRLAKALFSSCRFTGFFFVLLCTIVIL